MDSPDKAPTTYQLGDKVLANIYANKWKEGTVVGTVERVRRRWPRRIETKILVESWFVSLVEAGTQVHELSAKSVVPNPSTNGSSGVVDGR